MPSLDPALTAELQQLLDTAVADGFIPGAVLSVQAPGYAPWTGASGLADRDQQVRMTPSTPIRIASVSKMFTAVVVMQLVEEGTIALGAPVATWFPDLLPDGERITVRQLLQHTSGVYDYLEDRSFVAQAQRGHERVWKPEELVAYAVRFPSGRLGRWDYSSTNYVVLGMLVERVTGQSLAQQMRQRIFEPFDMRETVFAPQEAVPQRMAHGYSQRTDITNVSMSFGFATSSIVSTAEDLQRFGQALFAGDVLRTETRALMFDFVSGRGQYGMPNLEYGLGMMRNQLPLDSFSIQRAYSIDDRMVIGHIGGYGGFRTALWYAPASDVLITLSFNQAQADPNDVATAALDRVLVSLGR